MYVNDVQDNTDALVFKLTIRYDIQYKKKPKSATKPKSVQSLQSHAIRSTWTEDAGFVGPHEEPPPPPPPHAQHSESCKPRVQML